MKNKIIKGLSLTTLIISLFILSAGMMSSKNSHSAQATNNVALNLDGNTACTRGNNQVSGQGAIHYKNYAWRCYTRCWWNRGVRRCARSCY